MNGMRIAFLMMKRPPDMKGEIHGGFIGEDYFHWIRIVLTNNFIKVGVFIENQKYLLC